MSDPGLLLLAMARCTSCASRKSSGSTSWSLQQCVKLLLRLEKIGIRAPREQPHSTPLGANVLLDPGRADHALREIAGDDFFDYPFDKPGEVMRVISVRVSRELRSGCCSRWSSSRANTPSSMPPTRAAACPAAHISVLLAVDWEPRSSGLRRER